MRRVLPGALLIIDGQNHFAAALVRRHGFEHFLPAIEHADAGRAAHFVAGEREEIATDLLHIQRTMCPALCAASTSVVTPSLRARAQSSATGLIVPSELEMCVKANSFTSRGEQLIQPAQIEQAVVAGHRQISELRAGAFGQQLPRHDVAVMLHFREQDFVAGFDVLAAPGLRDQVDAFGRAARENDFVRRCGIDEFRGARRARLRRRSVARLLNSWMPRWTLALSCS